MGIGKRNIDVIREVFAIPGLLGEPFLQIGHQRIRQGESDLPEEFNYPDLAQMLEARGLRDVKAIDYFDPKADLRYDLNLPVPEHEHERYHTVIDIGTLEHLFDTRQALENCLRMVKVGGHYFLRTPVKGWFEHGFHTFDPRMMIQALAMNNFEVVYRQFSSQQGEPIDDAGDAENSSLSVVGRKTVSMGAFQIPQQERWADFYEAEQRASPDS